MIDEFFDDEQELMGESGTAEEAAAAADASAPAAEEAPRPAAPRQAPPFWMVLAIAAVALALGVVIGYLVGTASTLSELRAQSEAAAASDVSVQLPEGHPDLDVDEDGTATVAAAEA